MKFFSGKSSKNVVVLGSSGNVGAATLKVLASAEYSKLHVKAGVRDLTSEKSKALVHGSNIELIKADLSSPADLSAQLTGADSVFIVTPGDEQRAKLVQNGLDAAKAAGAKHVLVVSVLTAEKTGTVFGDQFTPIEANIRASGLPYTIIRLPLFIDNNWGNVQSIKGQSAIYGPNEPSRKFAPVAVQDIAEVAAKILAHPTAHLSKTYNLTTTAYNNSDLAAAFTKALGRTVNYVQVPYEAAEQSMIGAGYPQWQVTGILDLLKFIDANDATIQLQSKDLKKLLGREPTTVQQWVDGVAAAFQ